MINEQLRPILATYRTRAIIAGAIGVVALIAGLVLEKEQFFRSYLFGYTFFLGIALGAQGFYMIHVLTGGAWGFTARRILLAAMHPSTLLLMLIAFVPILFGLPDLFPWLREGAMAHSEILARKEAYLNLPFFLARAIGYFALWIFWSWRLVVYDRRLEETGDITLIGRMQNFSGAGLVVLMVTGTFASIDWMMSLEPEWYSTMFGGIVMVGFALSAITMATLLVIRFSKVEPLASLVRPRPQVVHDLGNLMFGFIIVWSYVSFVQYLIIWAGNISDEAPWFIHRQSGGWEYVGLALILFHFAGPFLLLLSRKFKRRYGRLATIAWGVMIMRVVDIFWDIAPSFNHTHFVIHWLDLAALLGVGGVFMWWYFTQLGRRGLLNQADPRFAETFAKMDAKEAPGPEISGGSATGPVAGPIVGPAR